MRIITLFSFITMLRGIDIIPSHIRSECEKYPGMLCGIMSVPRNIVMDLNNVMIVGSHIV